MIEEIKYKIIERLLRDYKFKTITLDDLYKIAAIALDTHESKLKTTEYNIFFTLIKGLENRKILTNRGYESNNRMVNTLYFKYNIIKINEDDNSLSDEDKIFLYSLNPNITTSYYFKNPKEIKKDRNDLIILNSFMNELSNDTPYMGINERSYELFKYEKRFSGSEFAPSLLQRTRINADNIHCYDSYTPLQCYITPRFYKRKKRTVLLIENLDTYWSFHRAINETKLYKKIDMLVFGGGKKATGNFKFHKYYSITPKDKIYYFGDIDAEGIAIFNKLRNVNSSLNIKLAECLYSLAIEIAEGKGIRKIYNLNQIELTKVQLNKILDGINEDVKEKIENIILSGQYVPQEALNYRILKENEKNIKIGD